MAEGQTTTRDRWWVLTDKALAALGRPPCDRCGALRVPVLNLPWREDVKREDSRG